MKKSDLNFFEGTQIPGANQAELATLLQVDRTSVHAWQRKGLPHLPAD